MNYTCDMLTVKLLGSPQVVDGQGLIRISRRKSRAFLYYLAASPNPKTRSHLLAFFWPDHERSSGQQILRTTLHELRKTFGAALVVEEESIGLSQAIAVDARQFEVLATSSTLDQAQLMDVLPLYRGEFLETFVLPDSAEFDTWQTYQAEHYRSLYTQGMARLSQLYESNGDYPNALQALDNALKLDPLQEDLQRVALRLQYLGGDRPAAVRRYETLRKLLDEELGVPPMSETRQVYQAILTDSFATPEQPRPIAAQAAAGRFVPRPDHQVPFIGRASEMQQIKELVAEGTRRLILIEGEAGIGKTRLAEEFLRKSHALTLVGTAHELDLAQPYQPVIEALRSLAKAPAWPELRTRLKLPDIWIAETSRLVPDLFPRSSSPAPASATATEARLWEGINQLLQAINQQEPVICYIDDIHWADPSTLALLGYLLRQPGSCQIGFMAATRPAPPRSPLASLLQTLTRENRLTRLPLGRLSTDEILNLSSSISPSAPGPLAEWLDQNAEGNPYFVTELIGYAFEKGLIKGDGQLTQEATTAAPVVPASVYSILQDHLSRLSEPARRLLDTAATAGREFELDVVTRASGLSDPSAMDALGELLKTGLIDPLDDRHFTFHHSLMMEVAYREMGEARHRLMHHRVAEGLKSVYHHHLDAVAGLLAWHYSEGNAPELAAPFAFQAGNHAASLAGWQEAIGFYEQALSGETNHKQRIVISLALGDASMQAGDLPKAADAYHSAIQMASGPEQAQVLDQGRLGLARAYLLQGRYEDVLSIVQKVLAVGRISLAAEAELTWGTALSLEGSDLEEASNHLMRAEHHLYSYARPDSAGLANIKFEQGSVAAQQGNLEKAISLYRQALQVAVGDESALYWQILANNNLGYHLLLLGDPSAIDYAQAGYDLAMGKGMLNQLPYLHSTLGEIALASGNPDLAESHFTDGLRLAEQFSLKERIAGLTANLGLVANARGQKDLAIHHLSTALALSDDLGTRHLSAQIRIWLVPLLPADEARYHLREARAIAEAGHRQRLLNDIIRLEKNFPQK